jgi:FkbM family methyltransferase
LLDYFRKRREKKRIRKTFREYGSHIESYDLPVEGRVDFALWDNPLEAKKQVTQAHVDFYKRLAPRGSMAIDIGAHIGDTTVPMALAVGREGLTLAFDPNPYVFKVLTENAGLNRDKTNIVPVNCAISVEEGEFFYNSSEATFNNGGISTQEKSPHGKYHLAEKVKGVNLQSYLRTEHGDRLGGLSLIKVDTEGYDLEIIRSIRDLLARYRPSVIAECFKGLAKRERFDLFDLFAGIDYEMYRVAEFSAGSAPQKIGRREDMKRWPHFDFLAIPSEKSGQILGGPVD